MIDKLYFPCKTIDLRPYYAEVMCFMYRVIIASESLLEEAIKNTNGKLKDYFSNHLEEERKHEKWLEQDLAYIGISDIPYHELAAEMAGTQYYILKHENPIRFLGYLLFLEGFPADKNLVNSLESMYGKDAVRTIRYHSEHDIDHSKELIEMINELPENEQQIVLDNAQITAYKYCAAVKQIISNKQIMNAV